MARRIVITSGKGGVGKTTVCAGLGQALAAMGVKVCLVDLDTQLNNLDCALKVENKIVFDIVDVVNSRVRCSQALLKVSENLYLLPSCQGFASHAITDEKLKKIFNILNEMFEIILIDCPAGLEEGFVKAIANASEAIVVANPHIFSLRDASKALRVLKTSDISKNLLILNRVRGDLIVDGEEIEPIAASELVGCELLGLVPDDDDIIVNGCLYHEAFNILARNLLCGDNILFDATKKYKGIFGKLKRALKRA